MICLLELWMPNCPATKTTIMELINHTAKSARLRKISTLTEPFPIRQTFCVCVSVIFHSIASNCNLIVLSIAIWAHCTQEIQFIVKLKSDLCELMRTTKTNKQNEDTNLKSGFVANIATLYRAVFLVLFELTVCAIWRNVWMSYLFITRLCWATVKSLASHWAATVRGNLLPLAFAASFEKVIFYAFRRVYWVYSNKTKPNRVYVTKSCS